MLQDYKPQLDTPKRQGRLALAYLQATFSDGSGTFTQSADNSSPRCTLTRNGTGQYTVTFPKVVLAHLVGLVIGAPESAGANFVNPEVLTPASGGAGTLTIETSTTLGTAADPVTGSKLYVTLLLGN
jgi:hypothetical protein